VVRNWSACGQMIRVPSRRQNFVAGERIWPSGGGWLSCSAAVVMVSNAVASMARAVQRYQEVAASPGEPRPGASAGGRPPQPCGSATPWHRSPRPARPPRTPGIRAIGQFAVCGARASPVSPLRPSTWRRRRLDGPLAWSRPQALVTLTPGRPPKRAFASKVRTMRSSCSACAAMIRSCAPRGVPVRRACAISLAWQAAVASV